MRNRYNLTLNKEAENLAKNEQDEDKYKSLTERVDRLEDYVKKATMVGGIVLAGLVVAVIFNGLSTVGTEEARWGLEDRR